MAIDNGDFVRVNFTGKIKDTDDVFDTTYDEIAQEAGIFEENKTYKPIPIVVGGNHLLPAIEEAIEIANQSKFGLSGGIITRDTSKALKVSEAMECGGFVVNGASFFRSFEQPFGGWKYSGIGNEGIMTTLREMSRTKTVILKNIMK